MQDAVNSNSIMAASSTSYSSNSWASSHILTNGSITQYTSNSNPATDPNHLTQAEIDLSEGVWKQLGLSTNSYVNVTFNWINY